MPPKDLPIRNYLRAAFAEIRKRKEETAVNEQDEALRQEQNKDETEKLEKKIKRAENSVKRYQWFILRLLVFLAIVWVLFFKVVGLTHMPNEDMYPRIDAGDLVLFYRLSNNIKAQDIVVLEKVTPDGDGSKELFICRVVAAPGDTVDINSGNRLVVNGNTMIESNIFYDTPAYEGYTEFPLTLGDGEWFVLADSRKGGADSRYFGPVTRSEIKGTVLTILRRNNL